MAIFFLNCGYCSILTDEQFSPAAQKKYCQRTLLQIDYIYIIITVFKISLEVYRSCLNDENVFQRGNVFIRPKHHQNPVVQRSKVF